MPTYDYMCLDCEHEWEEFHSIVDEPTKVCPNCNKETAKRMISGGSGKGVVKLSWQEQIANVNSDVKDMKQKCYTNENYLANMVGETRYNQNQNYKW